MQALPQQPLRVRAMKNKKLLSLLRTVFLIAVSLVLGFNIYSWNARSLTGNVLPTPFGYGGAVVLSGSMEPAIMTGDMIIVKVEESYADGDVVVYQTGKMLVVHRIVASDETTVTTRGDANNANDTPIDRSQIKGKVIYKIPYIGTLVRLLKTPAATILLILGAVLTVELPYRKAKDTTDKELERIKAEIRRLKEEQND